MYHSLVIGYSSSVSNFCETLLGEKLRTVITDHGRVIFRQVGDVSIGTIPSAY